MKNEIDHDQLILDDNQTMGHDQLIPEVIDEEVIHEVNLMIRLMDSDRYIFYTFFFYRTCILIKE